MRRASWWVKPALPVCRRSSRRRCGRHNACSPWPDETPGHPIPAPCRLTAPRPADPAVPRVASRPRSARRSPACLTANRPACLVYNSMQAWAAACSARHRGLPSAASCSHPRTCVVGRPAPQWPGSRAWSGPPGRAPEARSHPLLAHGTWPAHPSRPALDDLDVQPATTSTMAGTHFLNRPWNALPILSPMDAPAPVPTPGITIVPMAAPSIAERVSVSCGSSSVPPTTSGTPTA